MSMSRFLYVAVVAMVIISAVQYFMAESQDQKAASCQMALLKVMVSRSTANEEERAAGRALTEAIAIYPDGHPVLASRLEEWLRARTRADEVRATEGNLKGAQANCVNLAM